MYINQCQINIVLPYLWLFEAKGQQYTTGKVEQH